MSKIMDAALDPSCRLCILPNGWYSPLRQGVVWPGPPRNFATEPATWYDLMRSGLSFDPSHDYEFTFTFTLAAAALPTTTDRYLMDYGSPVTAIFGAFYANGGGISCCCGLFKSSLSGQAETAGEAITLVPNTVGVPLAAGEHSIRVYAAGNSLYAKLDDGDFIYAKSTSRRSDLSILTKAPVTSHNGGVNAIAIRDLTDQSVRWSYPSPPERLRLVTYANVLIMPGYFGAANPALGWSIKTALPAGLTGTVLAKINGAVVTDPPQWNRTAATFTAAASATLDWLMVFDTTLTAGQIADLSN